jgi:hypothetical protein
MAVRGRVPRYCPPCRTYDRLGRRWAECAWCGHHAWLGKQAIYCSQRCHGNAIARPVCRVEYVQCTRCATWKTTRSRCGCPASARTPRQVQCERCGTIFMTVQPTARTCSDRCSRKAQKLRRRTREAGSYGDWHWSDFMRVAQRFNYCCAYCGVKPDRLDPDHVMPLGLGGLNVVANLLPTCQACNSDKRQLPLDDWNEDRMRRHLPPRVTTWAADDPRYWHLTCALESSAA